MRRLLTIISWLSISLGYAQIQKGTIVLNGSGSYFLNKGNTEYATGGTPTRSDNKNSSLNIQPSVGTFIRKNLMIGIGPSFQRQFNSNDNVNLINGQIFTSSAAKNSIGLSLFLSKYVAMNEKIYFRTNLSLFARYGTVRYVNVASDYKSDLLEYSCNITPSLVYFLNSKWAITGGVGQIYYHFSKQSFGGNAPQKKSVENSLGLNFELNTFSLGIQYFLRNSLP